MRARVAASMVVLVACTAIGWGAHVGALRFFVRKPNVLLITLDTLRADYLKSYGYRFDTSPVIDSLAASGVLFERAIAASSRTAPSHASIMTSLYPRQNTLGPLNGPTRLEGATTLAELYRRAGWRTAAFVSNIMIHARSGLDRGFELYDDDLPAAEVNRPEYFERMAEQTSARALEWLADVGDGPFFLWVHYQDPHGPYTPPAPYDHAFQVPSPPGEPELRVMKSNSGFKGIPAYQALEGLTRVSQYQALYAGEIAFTDLWLGRLLEAVDGHASGRETIVLLTSDHGESFGEDDRFLSHGNVTSPQEAHVPFILRAPGIPRGRRSETVSHVDVLPTLLELSQLPIPSEARGLALGPYLRQALPLPDRIVFCDIGDILSAYWPGHFARLSGASLAYEAHTRNAREVNPIWHAFRWDTGPDWTPIELDSTRMAPIRSYFEQTVALLDAPPLPPLDIDRLRALGYVSPE